MHRNVLRGYLKPSTIQRLLIISIVWARFATHVGTSKYRSGSLLPPKSIKTPEFYQENLNRGGVGGEVEKTVKV